MKKKTLYEILGVPEDATEKEIKTAYKRLALVHHPDRNDGKESPDFIWITHAYNVLFDAQRRLEYDKYGYDGENTFETVIKKTFTQLVVMIVRQYPKRLKDVHFLKEVQAVINKQKEDFRKNIKKFINRIEDCEYIVCHLVNIDNDTFIHDALNKEIIIYREEFRRCDNTILVLDEVMKLLKRFIYDFKQPDLSHVKILFGHDYGTGGTGDFGSTTYYTDA